MKKILLFTAVFISHILTAQDEEFVKQLDKLISAYEDVHGFSGVVKVVLNEEPAFEKAYGLANRSFGIENDLNTRFSINSISKTFTVTAVMMLVEAGKVDLEESIGHYLPYLTASWKDSITIHQLLTHSSGLPRESGIQFYEEKSLREQADLVNQLDRMFTSADKYEYSNSGIILLGNLIEQVSGKQYHSFITKNIIEPLALKNTGVYMGRNVVENQATPYVLTSQGISYADRSKHYGENAGGGLYSTASDLYQFVLALEQHKLISKEYTDIMFSPHISTGEGEFEAYTWSIKKFGEETIYMAAGSGYGTKSVIIRSPEEKNFISITSNWGNTPLFKMLEGVFLTTKGIETNRPSSANLAKPKDYVTYLGDYRFNKDELTVHLGIKRDVLRFHEVENKLFLGDELLMVKEENTLGLTYTDELKIELNDSNMIIDINGNRLKGYKVD